MFRLYRINGTHKPDVLEYFEKLPKITAKFKEEIKEKHGSGAFFLRDYSGKGTKTHFVIEGLQNKNFTEGQTPMDIQTLMNLASQLQRIESKLDKIQSVLDDLFDVDETETAEPTKIDPTSSILAGLATNPDIQKALAPFGGIDGLKALGGLR